MDAELKIYLDEKFQNLVTKDYLDERLVNFVTKDDLKHFATKDDLKNFATKDDLKSGISSVRIEIGSLRQDLVAMEGRLNTTINELGAAVNETVTEPLRQLTESLKDYPLIREDVRKMKQILNLHD